MRLWVVLVAVVVSSSAYRLGCDEVYSTVHARSHCLIGKNDSIGVAMPWMVAILKVNTDNSLTHVCGGSLISRYHVLSAASCFKPGTNYRLRLGQVDLSARWNPYLFQELTATRVITHGEHIGSTNDVALVTMSGPANYSLTVAPVELASSDFDYSGHVFNVAGWGRTESGTGPSFNSRLKTAPLVTSPPEKCELLTRGSVWTANDSRVNHRRDYQICAETISGQNANICYGDFGGPLVLSDFYSGRSVQVGIASAVFHDCKYSWFPSLFTKVSAYRRWIDYVMNH